MRKVPFIILIIITIILGVATFYEKSHGSAETWHNFYTSWWMMTLWAAIVFTGFCICCEFLWKHRKPAMLLHFAFCVILLGALTTSITSRRGQIHLREDGTIETSIKIPFQIKLQHFEMDYYTGTTTPADYISHLKFRDSDKDFDAIVSMNNIFKYRGFRFYQASYDDDLKGTILSVSRDPYGIAITYTGYALLLLSMIFILFDKNGRFRRLLKSLNIIILILLSTSLSAQKTLSREEAKLFGQLSMSYNGRVVPIDTYAHDFTKKLTGNSSYKNFNAVQVLAGWIFFPEDWQNELIIKIKNTEIRDFINEGRHLKKFSFNDFFNEENIYKLQYARFSHQHKGMREANEKIGLIMAQQNGKTLRIFPQGNRWFSSTDDLSEIKSEDTLFVSKAFLMLRETLKNEDRKQTIELLNKLSNYQYKRAESGSISPKRTKIEIFYNRFDIAGILFKINLTFGLIVFILFIRSFLRTPKKQTLTKISRFVCRLQLAVSLILVSVAMGIRWHVSGHIPLSNGYETMMIVAWCILLITLFLSRYSELITAGGLLLSGFTLLVSSIGAMNPQITQLVPVLMSPLLSIHVSLLMVSYALFGFITFNGITAIILYFVLKDSSEQLYKLQTISRIMLYPALFTLTIGIFVGAVWANVSWGRYWGWDPKEVWALITMLIYSLAMHDESLTIFRKPLFFHIFAVFAFLSVLMTYFGVSAFLGGMHSY